MVGCGNRSSSDADTPDFSCAGCNLVLISIDTLRADHLSCYGYTRDTSPNIDSFARASLLFEQAFSTSHQTADSHMSILTSLYPSVHGVRNATDRQAAQLPSGVTTLALHLERQGYRTGGFHGGGNLSPIYGFGRGFETYEETTGVEATIDWILTPSEKPFFAFHHTYGPHDPYLSASPYGEMFGDGSEVPFPATQEELDRQLALMGRDTEGFASIREAFWSKVDPTDPRHVQRLIDLYDGKIRQTDAELAPLLSTLEKLDRPTVVVITSDHGEEFQEHGLFRHHKQLYSTLLRVPLVLRIPGAPTGRVSQRMSLIDLAPTLLEILGSPPLDSAQGRSFLKTLSRDVRSRPIFGEKVYNPKSRVRGRPEIPGNKTLIKGRWKLVYHRKDGIQLFDFRQDPAESINLADSHPDKTIELMTLTRQIAEDNESLRDSLLDPEDPVEQELDDNTLEKLQALGYLE